MYTKMLYEIKNEWGRFKSLSLLLLYAFKYNYVLLK